MTSEIAAAAEITPGTWWKTRAGDRRYIVGKRLDGNWQTQREDGTVGVYNENHLLAPWSDPPKPRTFSIVVYKTSNGNIEWQQAEDRDIADLDKKRVSDVVEVTLTEKDAHV